MVLLRVALAMALRICLLRVPLRLGFSWDFWQLGWERLGLPVLSNLAGRIQHFLAAILEAWRTSVSADLSLRKGFHGGSWLETDGTLQLLWPCLGDKALLGCILVGGVLNGFLPGKFKGQHVPCRFCGGTDGDGHLFWDCTFFCGWDP